MKILHLCSDYAGTPLYRDLVESIHKKDIYQTVYIPVRSSELMDKFRSEILSPEQYYYSFILNPYLRLDYFRKIRKMYRDITGSLELSGKNLVHAHFLFSDGGVALLLKRKLGIKYVVTVRNTDIFSFYRYMLHLRRFGLKVLLEAERIIFLSGTYQDYLLRTYIPAEYQNEIETKSMIIPNGLNSFWLRNTISKKVKGQGIHLLYVGEFSKNKNIPGIIKVLDRLQELGIEAKLSLVGQYGDAVRKIAMLVRQRGDYIASYARTDSKDELLKYYREADVFIMPSYYETFGLVYLEAMSQGLPLIYSKGQGIDGYFEDGEVGYAVDPDNIDQIVERITQIAENYDRITLNCLEGVRDFSWEEVAEIYSNLYFSIGNR